MEYHSVYMIFNLLFLNWEVTGNSDTKIDDLENAFYEYQDNINHANQTYKEFDFEEELEKIIKDYSSIFVMFEDELSFISDDNPEELYEKLTELLDEYPTPIDLYMEDFLYNENIYFTLNLKTPTKEMEEIFKINILIFELYQLLAKKESEHNNTTSTRFLIYCHLKNLKDFLKNADKKTRTKISVCIAHYNERLLSEKTLPNINQPWHIALLSEDKSLIASLLYDKIDILLDYEEEENPEKIPFDSCYLAEDIIYFLTSFLLYLNNHIKTLEDSKVKEQLIKRKYLLLATGTLPEIEEYYLDQGTLDNLTLPPFRKEGLRKTSFNFLVYNFSELISNINIPNINMTIEAEEKAIISLLLIKCYIDLSINEEIKQKLTDQLTDPNLYKNLNFSIITKLIDNIIFSNETRDYPSTIKQ